MDRVKVLVVDDEHMIRWSIAQTLRRAGCEVRTAGTGAEGLALFRELRPDVVFLDVRLPDQDGRALLEHMRREPGPPVAVVVMTAFGGDCTARDAIELRACDYLGKPFDFDRLEETVVQALLRGAHEAT